MIDGQHFAFEVDEEIEALFNPKVRRWWRGRIHDRDVAYNTYHVKFLDGDQREDVVSNQIRKYEPLKIGDSIFGKRTYTHSAGKHGESKKLRTAREEFVDGKVRKIYEEDGNKKLKCFSMTTTHLIQSFFVPLILSICRDLINII
jgi:hypothetical protein